MPKIKLEICMNYLNQKVITTINNIDNCTLEDNLITSQQALIPDEAVGNDQESMVPRATCSNKVGSVRASV